MKKYIIFVVIILAMLLLVGITQKEPQKEVKKVPKKEVVKDSVQLKQTIIKKQGETQKSKLDSIIKKQKAKEKGNG